MSGLHGLLLKASFWKVNRTNSSDRTLQFPKKEGINFLNSLVSNRIRRYSALSVKARRRKEEREIWDTDFVDYDDVRVEGGRLRSDELWRAKEDRSYL